MSCADNPFFLFPLTENYQLHYIRFPFIQITQQEQILAKYFYCIGKITNTSNSSLVKWKLSLLMARGLELDYFLSPFQPKILCDSEYYQTLC